MAAFRQRRFSQAGVTLAEMLVTVALLSVAASIAIPRADPVSSYAADAVAGEVARAVRFAQREAVRTNAWHRVDFDLAAQTLRVSRRAASNAAISPALHPLDKRAYEIAFGGAARAVLSSADFKYERGISSSYISFDPAGRPADIRTAMNEQTDYLESNGKVVIQHGNSRRDVVVEPDTGRVSF